MNEFIKAIPSDHKKFSHHFCLLIILFIALLKPYIVLINKCFTAFHHVVSKPFLKIYCTALLDHSIYTDYRNIYINWGLGLSPKGM